MTPTIAVVGAGRMGSALVRAFLKHGYATHVWNRTASKSAPLATLGAHVAISVQDAVAAADLIVLNVNDYATANRLLQSDAVVKRLPGKTLVQLTSGSPRQAREMAAWAAKQGAHYLDGAIMATPNLVGGPECTVLYAGPSDLFETHQPTLRALGEGARYVGIDVGHASALDSALLVVMWGALFAAVQGTAICEAEEIPLDAYANYLGPILPQVNGWVMDAVTRIKDGRLVGDDQTLATVDVHYGAFKCLLDLCKERGINRAVPNAFDQLFGAALEAGHAQDDFAVLSRTLRSSGIPTEEVSGHAR
jgi:3-hydroxyisobutyrate dehydrogenase-like beta-hydroxyacid dehydrogenase